MPRSLQATAGLLTGTMIAGITLGGLVGVLSALALGRFGRLSVRGVSLSLATIGFVSVSLLPFVAYPPNPPAIGDPDTIGTRTALYFIMLAISIIAAVTSHPRWRSWQRWIPVRDLSVSAATCCVAAYLPCATSELLRGAADFPLRSCMNFRLPGLITH